MKRIAITGSSGYVGQRLALALLRRPDVELVRGLDIHSPAEHLPATFEHSRIDVRRPFADRFVADGIDAAVHLAFIFEPIHNRALATAVNVDGTRNFLDACRAARVKSAVVLGSSTAYGAYADNPLWMDESHPLRAEPAFQYGYEKRLCDEMCAAFVRENPGFALVHLRAPIVLGPHVNNYVTRVLFKPKVVCPRGDDPDMQFLYEDDVAVAIIDTLQARLRGPYNLAGEGAIKFGELIHDFKRKPLALPAGWVRMLMAATYAARLTWINEMPPGALNYIRYPWLVDGSRLRRDAGVRLTHTTRDAVNAWRESVRHLLPRLGPAPAPTQT